MNETISNFLYGALGGGLVATGIRIAETYWIAPHFTESLEARKKLFMYASPLSHACHELKYRLNAILQEIEVCAGTKEALNLSPKGIQTIDWFTKSGYYLTSTAYLICVTSAWIQLYERDVVFLKFGRTSLTRRFFALIEKFKNDLSSEGSILWFHYVNGLGEQLVDKDKNRPMTMSEFIYKLYQDGLFRDYYDQLFAFLNQVAEGKHTMTMRNTIKTLEEINNFLEKNRVTISMD